jgi:CubicO group peptidase (beta-lactamase class C family)
VKNLSPSLDLVLRKYNLPALAGAIVSGNGITAAAASGLRKHGSNTPVTINDQFHLGSNTKAMTSTLLATLVEEGKLSWETTLEQVFSHLRERMNPAYRSVTVEQLLAHRAGFPTRSWPRGQSFLAMHRLLGTPREQRQAYVAEILTESPVEKAGAKFLYSNRSYAVAGAIAEEIMNTSWEDLMRQRIFQPLGIETAGYGAMGTPGKIDQPWQHRLIWKWHRAIRPGPRAGNPPVIAPASGAHCSIVDWAKFIEAHLRGEQNQSGILKPETFKRLHAFSGDYGFGWMAVDRSWAGGPALTHTGSNTMNYAVAWMVPAKDFAVLVMTNQGGRTAFKACEETATMLIHEFQVYGNSREIDP